MKQNHFILIAFSALTMLFNCTRPEDLPTVSTADVTDISQDSALSGGSILANGASVTVRGVCYSSTNNKPEIDDLHTTDGSGTGSFTSILTDLKENTTYYVRAYAMNSSGVAYGETKMFKTLSHEPEPNPNLTPTEKLCIPNGWILTSGHSTPAYRLPSGELISNLLWGFLHDYEVDDIIVFNTNGTCYVYPGILTNPNGYTEVTFLGTWRFDNPDTPQHIFMSIPFLYDNNIVDCFIETLTNNQFNFGYSFTEYHTNQAGATIENTYTFHLNYIPANQNKTEK